MKAESTTCLTIAEKQEPCIDDRRECEQLEVEIAELAAHLNAATYRLLCLIREFDEREGWAQPGCISCAHWLNWRIGLGLGAAREKVRVARALKELPKISDAFQRGELSYSKVRALTRIAKPETDEDLLVIAKAGTASHVERLVRAFRKSTGAEEVDEANVKYESRMLQTHTDAQGMVIIEARLMPEDGARVLRALESASEELWSEERTVKKESATDTDGTELKDVATADEPRVDAQQRRADALVLMAKRSLCANDASGSTTDRMQVVVHVDAEVLTDTEKQGLSALENGPDVPAETSRRLACDAGIVFLVEGRDGEPLSVGRRTRSIPPAIRRAMTTRDRGCRWPGCERTKHLQGHHLRHWADGGDTKLSNIILLCGLHHRLSHEGGYRISGTPDTGLEFSSPDRRRIPLAWPTPPLSEEPLCYLRRRHRKDGLEINDTTGLTSWAGEPIDYDLAVSTLMWSTERAEEQRQHVEDQVAEEKWLAAACTLTSI